MQKKTFFDSAVEWIDAQSVKICWETDHHEAMVSVYKGHSPSAIDRSITVATSNDGCARISGLDCKTRHYFELCSNGDSMIVAERRIRLDGAVNFRDLGGYQAEDGRRIKWGRIFRSDGLSRLSDRDLDLFKQLGICKIFDFRAESEIYEAPDRLPEDDSITYFHLPVIHGKFDFTEAVKRLKKGDSSWLTPDFMVNGYINNIEEFAESWATVFHHLPETVHKPLVFHCTGGKDRTGTCAALILMALGVPEEAVIDDHQLSNIYIAELLPKFYESMSEYGVDPDIIFPYLTAPRECIVSVVDYINDNYGSAADYLIRKTSLTEEKLESLRDMLLE